MNIKYLFECYLLEAQKLVPDKVGVIKRSAAALLGGCPVASSKPSLGIRVAALCLVAYFPVFRKADAEIFPCGTLLSGHRDREAEAAVHLAARVHRKKSD